MIFFKKLSMISEPKKNKVFQGTSEKLDISALEQATCNLLGKARTNKMSLDNKEI